MIGMWTVGYEFIVPDTVAKYATWALQITFQPTTPMPTHLLALCSGRLKGKIQKTKSGMEVGVWAPPSLEEVGEVDLALDVSV